MATKKPKKRNPQDATRARDVAPLRRRLEKAEDKIKQLQALVERITEHIHEYDGVDVT